MIQSPLDNLFLNFTDSDNISDDEEEEIIMMLDNANIIAVEDEIPSLFFDGGNKLLPKCTIILGRFKGKCLLFSVPGVECKIKVIKEHITRNFVLDIPSKIILSS